MQCETVDPCLTAVAVGGPVPEECSATDVHEHLASCPRCRNEVADYRRLHTELGHLRTGPRAVADGLFDDIVRVLDEAAGAGRVSHRTWVVACSAVTLAGVVGAIIAVTRVRTRRAAA